MYFVNLNKIHMSGLLIDDVSCAFRMAHIWLSCCSQKAMRWVRESVKQHPQQHHFDSSDTFVVKMIEPYKCQEIHVDSNIPLISFFQHTRGMFVWTHQARRDRLISESKVTNFHLSSVFARAQNSTVCHWMQRLTSCFALRSHAHLHAAFVLDAASWQ